ncbi:carbohydrate ABC transporter permease [Haloplasma contractile]|uniref:ABC transporter permease protein YtcP n=1 Tax=Haloplasma contractile SSD-17B TaxID=1033810 RepID=U2EFE0_9MOLU|nr:carbohydrate ABC transporter permease [Haloplasma contractile]ERJ13653.1 putative ABC transporter permease protein YtcP [Haloplasma contractile SSD-17B]
MEQTIKQSNNKIKPSSRISKDEKIFSIINYTVLILFGLACLYPFLNVIAVSFSEPGKVISGQVSLFPKGFNFVGYKYVFKNEQFFQSLKISILVTTLGTLISVMVMTLAAYPLSKKDLPGRKGIMVFFIIVMLFSGGIIPNFLLVKEIGLLNTTPALIFPSVVQVFHLLLLKNYFEGLPKELEESAKIDGASNMQILFRIIAPISIPVIATVSLFTAVIYWNNYFNAMLYTPTNESVWPLPFFIYNYLNSQPDILNQEQQLYREVIKAATVISSTIPILLVYPFMQRFFVKGVVVGSVKG